MVVSRGLCTKITNFIRSKLRRSMLTIVLMEHEIAHRKYKPSATPSLYHDLLPFRVELKKKKERN